MGIGVRVRVVQSSSDADTTIVSEALKPQTDGKNFTQVAVMADDTNILCLLLHHCQFLSSLFEIVIKNVTSKKIYLVPSGEDGNEGNISKGRVGYSIQNILGNVGDTEKEFILFAHAATGCDTVSAIHNFGKISIFESLKESESLRRIAKSFYNDDWGFLKKTSLAQIRRQKYDGMVGSTRKSIDTWYLPPTSRAVYFHGLRAYH